MLVGAHGVAIIGSTSLQFGSGNDGLGHHFVACGRGVQQRNLLYGAGPMAQLPDIMDRLAASDRMNDVRGGLEALPAQVAESDQIKYMLDRVVVSSQKKKP